MDSMKPNEEISGKIESPNNQKIERKRPVDLKGLRIHYSIILIAIVLTAIISLYNNVSINTALMRSFYVGVVFWVIAEIIEYIINRVK